MNLKIYAHPSPRCYNVTLLPPLLKRQVIICITRSGQLSSKLALKNTIMNKQPMLLLFTLRAVLQVSHTFKIRTITAIMKCSIYALYERQQWDIFPYLWLTSIHFISHIKMTAACLLLLHFSYCWIFQLFLFSYLILLFWSPNRQTHITINNDATWQNTFCKL